MTNPGELTVSQALTQSGPFLLTRVVAQGDELRHGKTATRRLEVINLSSDWGFIDHVTVEWPGEREPRRLVIPAGVRLAPGEAWAVIDSDTPDAWGGVAHRTYQSEFGEGGVVHQVTVHAFSPAGQQAMMSEVTFGFRVQPQGVGFFVPSALPLGG